MIEERIDYKKCDICKGKETEQMYSGQSFNWPNNSEGRLYRTYDTENLFDTIRDKIDQNYKKK